MTVSSAIMERIDPLTAAAARPVTRAIAVGALLLALVGSAVGVELIVAPLALVMALLSLAGACALLVDRTHHRAARSAIRLERLLPALLPALLLMVLLFAAGSTFGADAQPRDDWALFAVGLCLMALAPYRPAREIAAQTAALTIVAAVLALAQSVVGADDSPVLVVAVAGSLPIAVLGFAGAAYAASINGSILAWHDRAWRAAEDSALASRGGIARSVQQNRITVLNQQVVPYLGRLVEAETVTEQDREDARALAASIRQLLVADAERGWAQTMLAEIAARRSEARILTGADDPDDLARRASLPARTLLRAVAGQLVDAAGAIEVQLALRPVDGRLHARFDAITPRGFDGALRSLRPTIDVVRGLTELCRVRGIDGRLTLEFHYGD